MTNIHSDRILILDFGSQYTQLIARRVREIGVYCELFPYDVDIAFIKDFNPKGIILSGGPDTVTTDDSARAPQIVFDLGVPILRHLLRHANHGHAAWRPSHLCR